MRVFGAVLSALLLLVMLATAALADDAVRVSSRSEPQSVVSEQDVTVTIKVYNTGSSDITGNITLFDSDGSSVETYSGLKAGQTVTYTGTWHVNADQISAGKISFYIRYPAETEGADPVLRQIPITIQTEAPQPQLTASYTVSPQSARAGQQVTASYTLSNTGNVELRSIEVSNEGFSAKKLTAASLAVGSRVTLTDTVTMGSTELVSDPTVTYQQAGSDKTMTLSDLGKHTVSLAQNGLEAVLSCDNAENVYPGSAVNLTLSLKNSGETAMENITAMLPDGTSFVNLANLAAGGKYDASVSYVPAEEGDVSAVVHASLADGGDVTVTTNNVNITMQDMASALLLNVRAEAQNDVINSEPAVLRFAVEVENIGETDAATLTVTEAGTTVATIPSLPSGEKKLLVLELQLSMAGQVQFAVTGKDALGNERTYTSEPLQITYIEPTPVPTFTPVPPTPTPAPTPEPTATPAPTLMETIQSKVDPVICGIVAAVIAAILALILIVKGVKKSAQKKLEKNAIDSFVLTNDTRDSFGRRRRRKTSKQTGAIEQIAKTEELKEEDTHPAAAEEPKAAPASGEVRRRGSHDAEVPQDRTLKVAPVGERPEEPSHPAPNNSRTRIFTREEMPLQEAAEETKRMPAATEMKEASDAAEKTAVDIPEGSTQRLDRKDIETVKQAAGIVEESGKKPKKEKKKGFFGFGRKKKADDEIVEDPEDGTDEAVKPEDDEDDYYE